VNRRCPNRFVWIPLIRPSHASTWPGSVGVAAYGDPMAEPHGAGQPVELPFDDPEPTSVIGGASRDTGAVEIRQSARRRRTVSAYRDGERTVVLVPARMSRAERERWAAEMVAKLDAREARTRPSDEGLMQRAEQLSRRYLHGRARPVSVRWAPNQNSRWGSCTIEDATIRLSTRLQGLPEWVIDYVLLHELAHLLVPGHGQDFWKLLEEYPRTQRAWGYLEGVSDAWEKQGR
jgi:predicted metal-dependent hydrolase